MTKAGKNFDNILNELTQKKKHKKQMLMKTSSVLKELQQEEKELRQNIDELEELRRESSIAFYIERLEELKSNVVSR